ncbi:MAG TPA: N-formylglutamate amidohydrolase [Candidatus Gracilibacteria bacterium]|nr:N-formylglutamate amidohydrolase [Candidatus Gracilibacteria bacterium]
MYPILISIPHASTLIPEDLRDRLLLSEFDIRNLADLYTDQIFTVDDAHVLKCEVSRQVVDPNRFLAVELKFNTALQGIMPYLTQTGAKMYREDLNEELILKLLHQYYFPYHRQIDDILQKNNIRFLIDGHSMWSTGAKSLKDAGISRTEITLGNRDYTTCTNEQTMFIKKFWEDLGYQVSINDPYKGKAILKQHCYRDNKPGIQIELNRKLFLDEKTLEPIPGKIELLHSQFQELVHQIAHNSLIF